MVNMPPTRLRKPWLASAPSSAALFLLVSWLIVGTLLSYAYSSSLISGLTLPESHKGLRTWEDLLVSDYTIGVERNTYFHDKLEVLKMK